jgi:uncharacterized membrane protein (UPF0127 family)
MARWVRIRNRSQGGKQVVLARWCKSYFCRLRGMSFRLKWPRQRGLLFVCKTESIYLATIHMFGVFFSLGVIWLDSSLRVIDRKLARPFEVHRPSGPARYFLEGRPSILEGVELGDELEFEDETPA